MTVANGCGLLDEMYVKIQNRPRSGDNKDVFVGSKEVSSDKHTAAYEVICVCAEDV